MKRIKRKKKVNEESLQHVLDTIKQTDIHIIGVSIAAKRKKVYLKE
jgi:hypothetical protein